jgi:CRP-like cAMP-binding protein
MVGVSLFLEADTTAGRALVQVAGEAARIGANAFREALQGSPGLRRLVSRYTLTLINLLAQNGACNAAHLVEERCARWLLMAHDRVNQDSFPITQEFLAQMLGVRRPTVSLTAGILQRAGFIAYRRGMVTILDREGLEGASCECYRVIQDEFKRLVGPGG